MLNDYFEAVFCINLARRPDRRAQVEQEFAAHGIKVEYVDGVDGKLLGIEDFKASDNETGRPGDIGCTMSHLKVLQLAMSRGLKNYFVFEDDVELAVNFNEQFIKYIPQLPEKWEMIYLGGNHDQPVLQVGGTENIVRITRTFTTHAFGAKASIYPALHRVLERHDKVDLSVSTLHPIYNCYCFRPHIAFQRSGFSDILNKEQDYRHLRNYQYVPLGQRCSAATIMVDYFNRRQSLPFDWVDMPLTAILELVSFDGGDVEGSARRFISGVRQDTQRHNNGTWFPHDIVKTEDFPTLHAEMTEKYVRRFKRLYNLFVSGDNLVFLTVIMSPDLADVPTYKRIMEVLKSRVKGQCIFVSVNLYPWECAEYDSKNNLQVNVNAVLGQDWAKFEADIADRLKNYEHSKRYFS